MTSQQPEVRAFDPELIDLDSVDFIDETERRYFSEARLGYEVIEWLRTDVGRLVHGRAKIDAEDAKERLVNLDLSDPEYHSKASALKLELEVARRLLAYLAEAIAHGQTSEQQLETYRSQ